MNTITSNIYYISDDGENQRFIISTLKNTPNTWKVSKVQDTKPFGLLLLTYKQVEFDPHTDYIDWDTGEMFADYYEKSVVPVEESKDTQSYTPNVRCEISVSTSQIKVGGSYRLLTAKLFNENSDDITNQYSLDSFDWTCYIDGTELTYSNFVTWLNQDEFNKIKLKLANDRSYLNKVLTIKCQVANIVGEIQLNITI